MTISRIVLVCALISIESLTGMVAKRHQIGAISVVQLAGTKLEMGKGYGALLQNELVETLGILKDFFVTQHQIPYEKLVAQANRFYARYPYDYQVFLQGMAIGCGLSLDDCNVLNGMETLLEVLPATSSLSRCAFLCIPSGMTKTGATLIGRNYDFPAPFDQIAQRLVVTVLQGDDSVSSAIIGMPGQIYCPSCVNAEGIFMELNNGMPSGGSTVEQDRETLLVRLLNIVQNSAQLDQMNKQLLASQSDYSLIINTANKNATQSYEFSSTLGMKPYTPEQTVPFVSTNFYLNQTWTDIPTPTDANTWLGVTRRNNLLALANASNQHTVETVKAIMDRDITQGGARWALTIYQIIFDSATQRLFLKIVGQSQWIEIPLDKYF